MTKERYESIRGLVVVLGYCSGELSFLSAQEVDEKGELSDILPSMCEELDLIVSELKQRLEFIEL